MKISRTRVSAVIIKNGRLLVLKGDQGNYSAFYFTPGGKVEMGENDEMALKRELNEELDVNIKNYKEYFTYTAKLWNSEDYQQINCYLVELSDEIKLSGEITKMYWYGKNDYLKNDPVISESTYEHLIPKLIEDNLLK